MTDGWELGSLGAVTAAAHSVMAALAVAAAGVVAATAARIVAVPAGSGPFAFDRDTLPRAWVHPCAPNSQLDSHRLQALGWPAVRWQGDQNQHRKLRHKPETWPIRLPLLQVFQE